MNPDPSMEHPLNPAPPTERALEPTPAERPLDPTKLMRIAAMVREILDEARRREPNPDTANDLADLYRHIKSQLEDALPEFLAEELEAMKLDVPFEDGATADEVRVAYSALMGWLTGLFQGLQASFQAQTQLHMSEGFLGDQPAQISTSNNKKDGYL